MTSREELKPCPFCGGDAYAGERWRGMQQVAYCECVQCAGSIESDSASDARAKWDRRCDGAQEVQSCPEPYHPPFHTLGAAVRDSKDWYICECSSPFGEKVRDAMVVFLCDALNAHALALPPQGRGELFEALGRAMDVAAHLRQSLQEAVDTFADSEYEASLERWRESLTDASTFLDAKASPTMRAAFCSQGTAPDALAAIGTAMVAGSFGNAKDLTDETASAKNFLESLRAAGYDVVFRSQEATAADLCAAPGKADLTFGSVLDFMLALCFQRIETLDGNAPHRHYTECRFCRGTDSGRREGVRPIAALVSHSDDCLLARHLPRLKAMANKDVT